MFTISLIFILISQPSPVTNLKVLDTPSDAGESITITWTKSADDGAGQNNVLRYEIFRSEKLEESYQNIGSVPAGKTEFVDNSAKDGMEYYYYINAVSKEDEMVESEIVGPAISSPQWFNRTRLNVLVAVLFLAFVFLLYINLAKKGISTFIRKIPGLEAIDEAVGRSTEMGKTVLYAPGIFNLYEVANLASLSILRKVAIKTAEYGARILITNGNPLFMTAAQEVVKEAYLEAGRPDLYREADIFFLTGDQFGYAAGCDGVMVREKPGAVFLLGVFAAESLVLAETGYSIGAIQIAGTTSTLQLPFFVATCDYTLIGEEMLAAAAYLSKEPAMLGSLKGEDLAKIILIVLIVTGAILATIGFTQLTNLLLTG
jgi:hypothetical protein